MEAQEIVDMIDVGKRVHARIDELKDDNILTRQLVSTSEFMRDRTRRDLAYASYYDAVLELGTYKFTEEYYRPDDVEDGELKACFANAANLALGEPDKYTYVEGYACTEQVGISMAHAWVEDAEGRIIDNTWGALASASKHGGAHYYGIKFSAEYLAQRAVEQDEGFGGLLGENWQHVSHMINGMIVEDGVVTGERGS